jgi:hypothetical protein
MAKVKLNPMFKEVRGKLGDKVFRRMANGEIVMSQAPEKSNIEPTEAQLAHRERFKQASAYAKAALAEPKVRAHYEKLAAQTGKRPRALAISDYLKGKNLLEK